MNENHLATAVKESVTGVHMTTPAEQIVSRSRAIRNRRRIPVVAGALAVAAGTGLAVGALVPAGHQAGRPASAQLTAWTVARQSDGNVRVTIRDLRDPAGLQRKLRADGVPASVFFAGHANPSCSPYGKDGGTDVLTHVFTGHLAGGTSVRVIVIHPSALPSGAGVLIAPGHSHASQPDAVSLTLALVKASAACTGS
jgi:hypothetical protein